MLMDCPLPADPADRESDQRISSAAKITIALAEDSDRSKIYRIRHQVYALELGQHEPNHTAELKDAIDAYNVYLKAEVGGCTVGFVSITPPGQKYSVDKYFLRGDFPFPFDDSLYEIRLLTVLASHRGLPAASLLMYAALRWIEARCGTRVVAIGRQEVLSLYQKAGLRSLDRKVKSGAVIYELLTATVSELRENLKRNWRRMAWLEKRVNWQLDVPFGGSIGCHHGGAFFEAIGEDFGRLECRHEVINADVLDAWFEPSPRVIAAVSEHLPWLLRTSPPTSCGGMVRAIARAKNIPAECVVPAAGSSELIFLAFREWLDHNSRVLLIDPSYGEYIHIAKRIVRCHVDTLSLRREEGYVLHLDRLEAQLASAVYDLVVIVNPNSPTGRHVSRQELEKILGRIPSRTRVWIDETYVEYAGAGESLENFAAHSKNVVVCKSMSKVYALSGARAAYLCAPATLAHALREITPPWAVSLPAQVAAVNALEDPDYYSERYRETHQLREDFVWCLREAGFEVCPSVSNFLLCHLPGGAPSAALVSQRSRARGLYLRTGNEISEVLREDVLRIAVKDSITNKKMMAILQLAMQPEIRQNH